MSENKQSCQWVSDICVLLNSIIVVSGLAIVIFGLYSCHRMELRYNAAIKHQLTPDQIETIK